MSTARMQVKRGTATQWSTANPVLADGEWGYDTTNGIVKIGNGSTAWSSLATALVVAASYQPLDSDLTAIAALSTTTFGRALLALADAAALRSAAALGTAAVADVGTGASQLPTKTQVDTLISTAIANLVASAPGALDTLDELAAALGDDANFAATMTTALAGKQPLDAELTALAALTSAADRLPYFSGSGAASLATFTSFARTLLDDSDAATALTTLGAAASSHTHTTGAVLQNAVNTQTGTSYTFVLADADRFTTLSNASSITATIPPNSSVAYPVGTTLDLGQWGAGQVTVAPGSGVTLRYTPTLKTRAQYSMLSARKIGTDEWVVAGDLSAG